MWVKHAAYVCSALTLLCILSKVLEVHNIINDYTKFDSYT